MKKSWMIFLLMFCSSVALVSCSTFDGGADPSAQDSGDDEFGDEEGDDFSDSGEFGDESKDDFADDEIASDDKVADDIEENVDDGLQDDPPAEKLAAPEEQPESFVEPLQEEEPPVAATPVEPAPSPALDYSQNFEGTTITNIQYLANKNGGTISVEADGPVQYSTRMNPTTKQFIVEVPNSTLPDGLKRPYIMKDFGGAFKNINAYQNQGSTTTRIVVQMNQSFQPTTRMEGNSLLIIPTGAKVSTAGNKFNPYGQPKTPVMRDSSKKILEARSLDEFLTGNNKFYGRRISIQLKDADIRDVINFISEESGANIVLSEDVKGKITLKLRQVPWDQALVVVMRSKNLGYVRQGNVIRISSLKLLQEESSQAKAILEAQKVLEPLRVKVIPVGFAKVDELVKQVKPFLTPNRGQVIEDRRTTSIIVTDTDEIIGKVSRLIKQLDVPPAQVMIEGKIIEAGEEFERRVGVNWSLSGSPKQISPDGGANEGPINLRPGITVQPLAGDAIGGQTGLFNLSVGTLDFFGDFNAQLGLMQTDNLVKVISSPRIITLNGEKAEIAQIGQNVTIMARTDTAGNTMAGVQRDEVEMRLVVTPQITSDGKVLMDVDVKRQFVGPVLDAGSGAREIKTRTAKTKVLVKNGQTAVIGGIYQSDENSAENGVPYLKNVPVVGWLFKSKSVDKKKNELIIFLTPRITNADGTSSQSSVKQ